MYVCALYNGIHLFNHNLTKRFLTYRKKDPYQQQTSNHVVMSSSVSGTRNFSLQIFLDEMSLSSSIKLGSRFGNIPFPVRHKMAAARDSVRWDGMNNRDEECILSLVVRVSHFEKQVDTVGVNGKVFCLVKNEMCLQS